MNKHICFDELIEKTGSDATFEKAVRFDPGDGKIDTEWVIRLYHYTPSQGISMKRGILTMNFCPICGRDLRGE